MNGRALNEKAIEVSPSSSRVLDRAAEILTPFPPSKNRPRPGDWTCPSCGFSNFQRRTACFRCSYAAVGHGQGGDGMGGYGGGYGWGGPQMGGPSHHNQGSYSNMHHGGRMGGGGGMVPFRAGDWKCGNDGCGYHNFAKNINCLRCNASRAGAAVVADNSFAQPPMEQPTPNYGMGPPGHMGGNPPPGAFAPPHNYGGGSFGGASNYGASYGVSAAATPWAPMGSSAYPQSGGGHSGGFDSRDTQAAFASAGNTPFSSSSFHGGPSSNDNSADPFAFLNSGMSNLNVSDDARRNGNNPSKSPN